jgi:putative flippase GtrA
VDLSPNGLKDLARSPAGMKILRYSAVSAIGVVMTVTLFTIINLIRIPSAGHGFLVSEHHVRPWFSNVVAVGLTTIPTYYLNRAWVWGKRGKSHLGKEVLPFWVFSFAGLGLSTLFVAVANHGKHGKPTPLHQLGLNFAQLAGFGILWVARFFVLDKLMFGKTHVPHDDVDDAAHELFVHTADHT